MSPLPAAMNGIPPKISGFQRGSCPLRSNHSALHVWNGTPEINWSLQGLASQWPASMGIDRSTGQIARASVAQSVGHRGSKRGVALIDEAAASAVGGTGGIDFGLSSQRL